MEKVVTEYLSHLGVPISKRYCEECIVSHPDFPSLVSIADTLERLGIDHQIVYIEEGQLGEVTFPYILHGGKGGGLLLLTEQQDLETQREKLESGKSVVLKVDPAATIIDAEHNAAYAKEKLQKKLIVGLGIAFLGLFLIPLFQTMGWFHLLLFMTAAAGTFVGYLLLAKELGITYKPVESFCNAGKRTNCDRILNAEEATLFGVFTFSDAAVSYFAFQLIMVGLFIPLLNRSASFLWVLSLFALLALPVVGYSLYYQAVKAKMWCRLCVIVDALLCVQAVLLLGVGYKQVFVPTSALFVPLSVSLFLFAAVVCSVTLIKNRLQTAQASSREEVAAQRI